MSLLLAPDPGLSRCKPGPNLRLSAWSSLLYTAGEAAHLVCWDGVFHITAHNMHASTCDMIHVRCTCPCKQRSIQGLQAGPFEMMRT
jgi:hypothetical protein